MTDVIFADPQWVHALWGVLAAALGLVLLERRGGSALDRFVSPALQGRLVDQPTRFRRWLRIALLTLAGVALVVALMRPQWGVEFVTSPRVGAEIMIALDVSKSMLAEDVAPNRLERAKAEIRDLLPYLDGDQVGLIAFAGRASVLCPLTPDFSFLRLVLDGVDTGSVQRGGTRLEEPIRKAVKGFGSTGDLSRVLLLITDGEDHDSFPLDAAKEAAERGIRILAIGFGDEAGSQISFTDPSTGAREMLRDADGRPVLSRLDGDLLRELAVTTDGAYVPAGTGVLDLESIFEAHIRPLMRATGEERGKTVHKDGFQWAVLVALLALLGSVASQGSRARFLAILLLMLPLGAPSESHAQATPGTAPSVAGSAVPDADMPPLLVGEGGGEGDGGAADPALEELRLSEDPRDAYNDGLEALEAGELDDAERLLEHARGHARSDGEARFRATYNLAWVDVERASRNLESEPEQALADLERAADWLREAIALRPDDDASRRNLEIVLQRALVLADSLAEREPRDIEARLDALIEGQRGAAASIRQLSEVVQRAAGVDGDPNVTEAMRPQFKRVALEERTLLGDARALSDMAGAELDSLEGRADEELGPEEQMRRAQLAGLLHYLHRGRERMGQARSQLRQRRAERAYRRAATALSELKRARDQLLDPVKTLDGILADGGQLHAETRALMAAGMLSMKGPIQSPLQNPLQNDAPANEAPAWLTAPYLAEAQSSVAERIGELDARLRAGLEQPPQQEDPEQAALLEKVAAAEPLVASAQQHAGRAVEHLNAEALTEGLEAQTEALTALADARERFLDLRGLIELAYTDERRIEALLASEDDAAVVEYGSALLAFQERNIARVERLAPMLEETRFQAEAERANLDAAAAAARAEADTQRFDMADGLLALTESAMRGAGESLGDLAKGADALADGRRRVATAVRGLEHLRRLFFSIVEHIRDAARQQVELGDATEEAFALAAEDTESLATRSGPVTARQGELASGTESLAQALHEQSLADPAEFLGPEVAADEEAARQASEKLIRASELVLAASDEMKAAADGLGAEAPALEGIRERQTEAVQRLAEALEILQPPQEQGDQDQEQQEQDGEQQGEQQQEEQQQQQQEQGQGQSQPQPAEEQAGAGDPSQMLQAVRDREAERHRRSGEQGRRGYEPVEKDW